MILFVQLLVWVILSVVSTNVFVAFKEVFDSPSTGGFVEVIGLLAIGISALFYIVATFAQFFGALSIERKKSQFGWYIFWGFSTQILLLTFEKEFLLLIPLCVLTLDIFVQVCIKIFKKPKEDEKSFIFGL